MFTGLNPRQIAAVIMLCPNAHEIMAEIGVWIVERGNAAERAAGNATVGYSYRVSERGEGASSRFVVAASRLEAE